MHWVLQNDFFDESGHKSLTAALSARSLPHSVHRCLPGGKGLEPEPMITSKAVMVMGSHALMAEAQKRQWYPGALTNYNFDFAIQHTHWREHMLNSDAIICQFADVMPQPKPFFIRPTDANKAFVGRLTSWQSFIIWRDISTGVPSDLQVMVCSAKETVREYRAWIVNGHVATASLYKQGTRDLVREITHQTEDGDVLGFAETRAAEWSPHKAYCLDIAATGSGLKIVDVSTMNAAGLYAADVGKLVDAMEAMGGH